MNRASVILSAFALASCTQERQLSEFSIPSINAQVVVHVESSWHALADDTWRLTLRKKGAEETILRGSSPRKFNVEYDAERRTIVVFFCGGRVESFQSIVSLNGDTYAVQPIITPFEVGSLESQACAGSTFYSIQGH